MTGRYSVFNALVVIAWAGAACDDSSSKPANNAGAGGPVATSRPAPKPSPARDAAVAWAKAVAAGDYQAARKLSVGEQKEMDGLKLYVAVGASETKLNASLKEKFGGNPNGGLTQLLPGKLAEADEEATADSLTLSHEAINEPLVVKKQEDGTWKVVLSNLAAGGFVFQNTAAANEEVVADLGQYTSADEAWQAAASKAAARFGAPGGGGGGAPPGGGGAPGAK